MAVDRAAVYTIGYGGSTAGNAGHCIGFIVALTKYSSEIFTGSDIGGAITYDAAGKDGRPADGIDFAIVFAVNYRSIGASDNSAAGKQGGKIRAINSNSSTVDGI